MSLRGLILKARSCRRFHENERIPRQLLVEWVDLGRHCPSAGNVQPLKYFLSVEPETNAAIFPMLRWTGGLAEGQGPAEGERPAAYVAILLDKNISAKIDCDHGIVAHAILLGAVEAGFAGCMIGAIDREGLRVALNLPGHLEIALVVALGRPNETIVIDAVGPDGDTGYYRDARGVRHVPKRSLEDIIVKP